MEEEEPMPKDDIPFVPYPWFKAYENSKGRLSSMITRRHGHLESNKPEVQLVSHAFERFFSELTKRINVGEPVIVFYGDLLHLLLAQEGNMRDFLSALSQTLLKLRKEGYPIVLIAPSTPSLTTGIKANGMRRGGMGGLLQFLRGGGQDDDTYEDDAGEGNGPAQPFEGHPSMGGFRKRPPTLHFETPLDDFLGIPTVNVFPPVQEEGGLRNDSGGEEMGMNHFKQLLDQDMHHATLRANLKELRIAARGADVSLASSKELQDVIQALKKDGKDVSVLEERQLTTLEAERFILLAMGTAKLQHQNTLSNPIRISVDDFKAALSTIESSAHTLDLVRHGVEHFGVFKKRPSDRFKLSQHEERLLHQCLVPPSQISSKSTGFASIGGLARTKQIINELISLPLRRPELFQTGILKQSTTGILLFGPPGTGKTMLARAVAAESGANFLNVQMSQISSMWVGENEKNVKALFSLARKLSPCVIFVDEIDALLRVRQRYQPNWVTNTINEFMQEWDGVQSENNGVIVVGATNRPFDLDEAVLRRLPRRILVDLPTLEERKDILNVLLKDETLSHNQEKDVKAREKVIEEIAVKTDGFSGSDLKNLCIAAALNSLRENFSDAANSESSEARVVALEHFTKAIDSGDVTKSLNDQTEILKSLKDWDKVYGTGAGGYAKGTSGWGFAAA
ncbi:hypothetical protein HK102_000479 [Quaeritorhiza haematococci]|nr:hypothetical protein HK102_000479 [Quaeritorhiza haematococci]